MNRFVQATVLALLALAGTVACQRNEASVQYDPHYDSVLPTYFTGTPDMTILDDQRKIHDAMANAVKPAAAPATSAPAATAPAATPPA